ncbi:MAG: tetratricopeptide repeat protein [Nitrospinota bacterium]
MSGEKKELQDMASDEMKGVCPSCRQPVHSQAKKCHHCSEVFEKHSKIEPTFKKLVGYVGLVTAILSLFYALREGYYYIQERQEKRQTFNAYVAAGEHFLQFDNLEYAEMALQQAISIDPNNWKLRLRYFILHGRYILRETEDWLQASKQVKEKIPELIPEGFSLLNHPSLSKRDKATLLVMVGRLLPRDGRPNDPQEVTALLEDAYELAPNEGEVVFRLGHWLLGQEDRETEGLELLQKAIQLQPENALYWTELGKYEMDQKEYKEAIRAFEKAITLHPRQKKLQRIRAANKAKWRLKDLLLRADNEYHITSAEFLGLDMKERVRIIEFALEHYENDKNLNFVAANLYYVLGDYKKAYHAIQKALGNYKSYVSHSDLSKLELFVKILEDGKLDSRTLSEVRKTLKERHEREMYDQILETGYSDKRRYKLGLKAPSKPSDDGVLVIRAFEGYPFTKAGVRKGDRIIEFAHRKVQTLRDISIPLIEFEPGIDVPVKIKRGDEILDLILVVE